MRPLRHCRRGTDTASGKIWSRLPASSPTSRGGAGCSSSNVNNRLTKATIDVGAGEGAEVVHCRSRGKIKEIVGIASASSGLGDLRVFMDVPTSGTTRVGLLRNDGMVDPASRPVGLLAMRRAMEEMVGSDRGRWS